MNTVNPSFTKCGELIPQINDMPGPGPYYTCLVDMRSFETFPFDFALYFSTDHVPGTGGIWLYVCSGIPTEAKNWQSYDTALANGAFDHIPEKPVANPIFQETTQGSGHTETPHVQTVDGQVYMTYHKNNLGRGQATLLATSHDGIQFKRINGEADSIVIQNTQAESHQQPHTGYFRWGPSPFPALHAKYVGYSLFVGELDYRSAQWISDDAIHWELRSVFVPLEGEQVAIKDRILIWHEIDPASIEALSDGTFRAIACAGIRAAGPVARITELYTIYLNETGDTFIKEADPLLTVGESGTLDTEELTSPTSIVLEGKRHMIYVGTSEQAERNTVMAAVSS